MLFCNYPVFFFRNILIHSDGVFKKIKTEKEEVGASLGDLVIRALDYGGFRLSGRSQFI